MLYWFVITEILKPNLFYLNGLRLIFLDNLHFLFAIKVVSTTLYSELFNLYLKNFLF